MPNRASVALGKLLTIGGHVQLILAVVSACGLSGTTGAALWWAITPSSQLGYVFVVFLAMATLSLTFPFSAYAMNRALAWVEASRRKNLFDDPTETARRRIDGLIIEGQKVYEDFPSRTMHLNLNELEYHRERSNHWMMRTDAALTNEVGPYEVKWFSMDDNPDQWKPAQLTSFEFTRALMTNKIDRLRTIREQLPVHRKKWLRISLNTDIAVGRSLHNFLNSGGEEGVGEAGLGNWTRGVHKVFAADAPEYSHLFAPETIVGLGSSVERAAYVEERLKHLEGIAGSL